MASLERIVDSLKANGKLYALLILPFYLIRFIYYLFAEKSLWFCRHYPGHYSSTIPSLKAIKRHRQALFDGTPEALGGIALNEARQFELLEVFAGRYASFMPPGLAAGQGGHAVPRYFYQNKMYGFNDGFILYSFMREFKPSRIIEIGSGFSSALMVDTAESYLPDCQLTFIDPYSTSLSRLFDNSLSSRYKIIRDEIQNIDLSEFADLVENDILFVDSSHTLKIGSDLSYILFSILPCLNKGVIVHFHDIWWPFEYPEELINEGRAWNEIYLLRSFLQYNKAFEILFFNSFVEHRRRDYIETSMPGFFKNTGKSIWLRKVAEG